MAELKTKLTDASVTKFINSIPDEQKRKDCFTLVEIMKQATKAEPKMWGSSIVGFGTYHYKYASGREGDWMLVAFSPRKQNLTIYITRGLDESEALLQKLGKYSTGKGCLYIKRLDDIHLPTLKTLVNKSVRQMLKTQAKSA